MIHLAPLIHDLAVILVIAGIVSLIFQKIRQPVVLGYILAGIIVGPYTPPFPLVSDLRGIQLWAELGVIFLMFSLGLEISFRKMLKVGIPAGLTAIIEVMFMLHLGFFVGKFFNYSTMDSMFIGAMISISSTMIILKALDELKLKTRRFAELIFAVLVVEDILAVILLVGLTTIAVNKSISSVVILIAIAKLILVVSGWFLSGYFIIPRFIQYVGRVGTSEIVTLIALGLCLMMVVFAAWMGYSAALGAFIMGSILAESSESHRIQTRLQPLRDLFAAIFFVSIGILFNPKVLWNNLGSVLVFSLVTIVGKFLSVTCGAIFSGQSLRTSIQVGFGLAQIGEFSFIIATLGSRLNVTSEVLYPIGVAVSVVTTFTTPYLIRSSSRFSELLESFLPKQVSFFLSRYNLWMQEKREDEVKRKLFYQLLFRWFLNGLIVSILFISSSGFLMPWLQKRITGESLSLVLGWFLTLLLSSPFIWGLFSSFRYFHVDSAQVESSSKFDLGALARRSMLLISRLLALLWLGALSVTFLPIGYVISLTGIIAIAFFWIFYHRIGASYQWFEKQFLAAFSFQDLALKNESIPVAHANPLNVFKSFAPWDAQLIQMQVHVNSAIQMKQLKQSELRTRFGVSVIAIQRGERVIVAPDSAELVLPQDVLLVLGTEDQIEFVRGIVENPATDAYQSRSVDEHPDVQLDAYELRHLHIFSESNWVGLTIRSSQIREKYHAVVVGMEKLGTRIINPHPDISLSAGDILWVVGHRTQLNALSQWTRHAEPGH